VTLVLKELGDFRCHRLMVGGDGYTEEHLGGGRVVNEYSTGLA